MAIAGAGANACSSNNSTSTSTPVTIAYISRSLCNHIFDEARAGALAAQQNLSATGANVTVDQLDVDDCPADAQPSGAESPVPDAAASVMQDGGICSVAYSGQQLAYLQQAVASNASAIAIDTLSASCISDEINAAVAAGIPVITWDTDDPKSSRTTYYGIDNKAVAQTLVDVMAHLLGGAGGKIAWQTYASQNADGSFAPASSTTYDDRNAGFMAQVAQYPQLTVVGAPGITGTLPGNALPSTGATPNDGFAAAQVESVLQANPDLAGIVFIRGFLYRDQDLAAHAPTFVARRQAGTLKAVAFDVSADAFANMQANLVDLAAAQKYFGWGYDVVTLAYNIVTAHDQVNPTLTNSGWDAVCPNNLAEFINDFNARDFRTPLTPCNVLPPNLVPDAGQ
jgi:ribose transport system substrate-binding protein